jgi:hypothetical protein
MKNITASIFILLFSLPLFGQSYKPNNYSRKDEYLQKSIRKQRAGIIFLSSGALATAGGVVLIVDGVRRNNYYEGNGELNGGGVETVFGALVTVIGVGFMCGSIPFFVGAHRSRMTALGVSLKTQTAPLLYKASFAKQQYPALAFHISLGK